MVIEMTEETVPYECLVCDNIYNPKAGDPKSGIPPGVEFDALPDDQGLPGVWGRKRSVRESAAMIRLNRAYDYQ